jgi:hypothetical protein
MSEFRIIYKPDRRSEYVARIISARSASEAMAKVVSSTILGGYWTIRSITVQCEGTTKTGEPCQRFTHNEFCCEAHERTAA